MNLANGAPPPEDAIASSGDWLQPLHNWPRAASELLQQDAAVVRVLIAAVRGSAPREAGACMLVSRRRVLGTVGGGHLEWQAIEAARALLDEQAEVAQLQKLILGAELAQCCGGAVEVWSERYTRADRKLLAELAQAIEADRPAELRSRLEAGRLLRSIERTPSRADTAGSTPRLLRGETAIELHERLDSDAPPVWLFGAGHVGQALVRVLAGLPLRLSWIDSRAELFPHEVPDSVRRLAPADPVAVLRDAPANALVLVLTHDHALDYALCRAVLQRGEFAWLGLIGSNSKAASFRARLARDGLSQAQIARLVCPIGIAGIASKWPAAIAVSVAAQLLQALAARSDMKNAEGAAKLSAACSGEHCASCQNHVRELRRIPVSVQS